MQVSAQYLKTLQTRMDLISDNLANSSTTGFKQQLLSLEEGYDVQDQSNTVALYGGFPESGNPVIHLNQYDGNRYDSSQGALESTGNPLDLAISGEGFFRVKGSDGRIGYTRAGVFSIDGAGNLVNNEGLMLDPKVVIPDNVSEVRVMSDGTVYGVKKASETDDTDDADWDSVDTDFSLEDEENSTSDPNLVKLGTVSLYRFTNPDGLEQAGGTIFYATDASGKALEGISGEDGYGVIQSGMLEKSNTNVMTAMTDMIRAQRAYQYDIRLRQNQDEMMVTTIGMRG